MQLEENLRVTRETPCTTEVSVKIVVVVGLARPNAAAFFQQRPLLRRELQFGCGQCILYLLAEDTLYGT